VTDGPKCPECGAAWWAEHRNDCITCAYDEARQERMNREVQHDHELAARIPLGDKVVEL
jgi:Zn ribbon nucleic-acid-binding protein